MKVRIQLFAAARDIAGCSSVELELSKGASVADLRAQLAASYPALSPLLARSLVAIDSEYVSDATHVSPQQEIAIIPPVSGG
jgi:molybdopterin converting factor subunit 1